jgi:Tol biopolymer transport system component
MFASEEFNRELEALALQNITQLTFCSMGFEKAGEAYFSPDAQKIIFQAVPKGKTQYQIYVMDIAEGIPRMVSTGRGACTCAYFKPDGKKIIFASSHGDPEIDAIENQLNTPGYQREGGQYLWEFTPYMNVYEANLDGSNLTPLTFGSAYHAECAYSYDGEHIVFASNADGCMNLYTMNSDGTDVKQITFSTNSYNGGPFYSPDGNWIIFRADYDARHYLQIYAIKSDGTELKQLTNNGAVNWAPFWHPSGEVIAFTTSLHGHAHYEIYLMNVHTGVSRRLTHNATFDGLPVFSNDGNKMLWTSKRAEDGSCQLFIANFTMPDELW